MVLRFPKVLGRKLSVRFKGFFDIALASFCGLLVLGGSMHVQISS